MLKWQRKSLSFLMEDKEYPIFHINTIAAEDTLTNMD